MTSFRVDKTKSDVLFAFNVRELIPEDSDVFLFCDLLHSLDLTEFYNVYSDVGEKPIDPEIMLRTILYGLCYGIVSGNKVSAACKYDTRFMVLSGCQYPDRRTFDRFLIRHAKAMPNFFKQIVKLAQESGLVGLGRLAIDGTKFKANTSKHKAMSYGYMVKAVEKLDQELALLRKSIECENHEEATLDGRIPEEIRLREKRLSKIQAAKKRLEKEAEEKNLKVPESKAQKSFNDLDALSISNKGKDFFYGYNVQAGVDEKSQIVMGVTLHNSCSDTHGLQPVLEESLNNCDGTYNQVLADAAYGKEASNYFAIEAKGSISVIATGKGESEGDTICSDIPEYDEAQEEYRCP